MREQDAAEPVESAPAPPAGPSLLRRSAGLIVALFVILLLLAGIGWVVGNQFGWFTKANVTIRAAVDVAPAAPDDPTYRAVAVRDAATAKLPYAPGWPVALPGEIVATPVVADLLGDGHLEVIVPCYARSNRVNYVNPHPNPDPLLFAFRADGSVLPGWPIRFKRNWRERQWGGWSSSPSVFRKDGRDHLVIVSPRGDVYVIDGDRSAQPVGNADAVDTVPLVDLRGTGAVDLLAGNLAVNSDGMPISGFGSPALGYGYCPCIGDANGDGHMEIFELHYGHGGNAYPLLVGYNAAGQELPDWAKSVPMETWRPPAMGDIDGSGTRSVVGAYGHTIFAWHNTGQPLEGTETQGPVDGIFKRQVPSDTATPALADLTGSGHADIVVCDRVTGALHAWHADGKPVWPALSSASTRPADNGTFAKLLTPANGVSVASLGDDPHVMDFFAGTYWVRHFPDGHVTVTNMLPSNAHTEWAQPTIADLEHTGQADVIFGTTDGRLIVYRTGLAYHPERMEWPTVNGNFQHTGAWTPANKRGT